MDDKNVSVQTIRRLPVYLRFLRSCNEPTISATAVAEAFALNEVQVRKDLSAVSIHKGRSGIGYDTRFLQEDIEQVLGGHVKAAVLVGAGNLGRALLGYGGFPSCGMQIRAAFDVNEEIIGTSIHGIPVYGISSLLSVTRSMHAQIGILTVPAPAAQDACDGLVSAGIRAVWSFAPIHLKVPKGILVQNENLAASLMVLSKCLSRQNESDT